MCRCRLTRENSPRVGVYAVCRCRLTRENSPRVGVYAVCRCRLTRELTENPCIVIASLYPETPVPCTHLLCYTLCFYILRYMDALTLHPRRTLPITTHAVVQFEVPQHIRYVGVRGDEDQVRTRFVVIVPGRRQIDDKTNETAEAKEIKEMRRRRRGRGRGR